MNSPKQSQPAAEPEVIDPDEVTSAQEGIVVPFFAGERRIAGIWISPTYNQFAREAPVEVPGKGK